MKTEDQEGEAGKGETVKGQRERTKQATGSGQRVKARESSGSAGQGGQRSEDSNYQPKAAQKAVGLGQEGALRGQTDGGGLACYGDTGEHSGQDDACTGLWGSSRAHLHLVPCSPSLRLSSAPTVPLPQPRHV